MLSRRDLAMMLTMFGVVLLLFLSTVIMKEFFNDYDVNHAALEDKITLDDSAEAMDPADAARHVIYVGSRNAGFYHPVREWAGYRKMSYEEASDVSSGIGLAETYEKADTYLLLDGAALDADALSAEVLQQYVQDGGTVIFCSLPAYQTIQSSHSLTYLLGIQRFRAESVELKQIRLFEGFLLGGEVHYSFDETQSPEQAGMMREVPWYDISSRTKTYMVGFVSDQVQASLGVTNEDMPAIIWRTSTGSGTVFAVNGDYMDGVTALGILDAMVYESSAYSLYTVVNAQNLSVTGFPDLTSENKAAFTGKYGFDYHQFSRDILWPSLVAAAKKGDWKITAFFTTKQRNQSEEDADLDTLIEYLKYMNEESAEAGIAMGRKEDTDISQSLKEEREILDSLNLAYTFTGGYIRRENEHQLSQLWTKNGFGDLFPDVRSVVGELDEEQGIFSRLTDQIIRQSITMDGYQYTYLDDFRLKSLQTALGYSNVQADMYRIVWPENSEDTWEIVSEKLSSHMDTYWKPFSAFEKTTITESDRRVRLFLNETITSSASSVENGREVTIQVDHFEEEAWVILRTHGEELQSMEGGTWDQIEEGAYLLHLTSDTAVVVLQSDRGTHYYKG